MMQDPLVERLRSVRARYQRLREKRAGVLARSGIPLADVELPYAESAAAGPTVTFAALSPDSPPDQRGSAVNGSRLLFAPTFASSGNTTAVLSSSSSAHSTPHMPVFGSGARGSALLSASFEPQPQRPSSTAVTQQHELVDRQLNMFSSYQEQQRAVQRAVAASGMTTASMIAAAPPPVVVTATVPIRRPTVSLVSPSATSSPDSKAQTPVQQTLAVRSNQQQQHQQQQRNGGGSEAGAPALVWLDDSYDPSGDSPQAKLERDAFAASTSTSRKSNVSGSVKKASRGVSPPAAASKSPSPQAQPQHHSHTHRHDATATPAPIPGFVALPSPTPLRAGAPADAPSVSPVPQPMTAIPTPSARMLSMTSSSNAAASSALSSFQRRQPQSKRISPPAPTPPENKGRRPESPGPATTAEAVEEAVEAARRALPQPTPKF